MPTSSSPRLRPRHRVLSSVAATVGVWVPVMLMFLYAGLAFGIRCDEGCDPSAPGWKNNPHAWEWSAQWWGLALPALVAATVTVAYLAGGRARRAGVAGAVTGGLVLAWLIFMTSSPGLWG
jgi:uncharacterized membrane protein YkvI